MTRSAMSDREKTLALLSRSGWSEISTGQVGSMWKPADYELLDMGAAIGVPDQNHWDEFGMKSVVDRLAHWQGLAASDVEETIQMWDIDVTRLRADHDTYITDTIPLQAGLTLLASARLMFRSAATAAALGPRATIRGNYSTVGDELAGGVRMGHTEKGSYIVPILVPVGGPKELEDKDEPIPGLWAPEVESSERRMSRTFAEAFAMMHQKIVQEERLPGTEGILEMVAAGVTTEFVNAVAQVLEERAVATVDATFRWASSQREPAAHIERVIVPNDALDKLQATARKMRSSSVRTPELVAGPIVQVTSPPDDPTVGFAVQTVRRGKPVRVHSYVSVSRRNEIVKWFDDQTTVTVFGRVEKLSGSLRIRRPQSVGAAEFDFPDDE